MHKIKSVQPSLSGTSTDMETVMIHLNDFNLAGNILTHFTGEGITYTAFKK